MYKALKKVFYYFQKIRQNAHFVVDGVSRFDYAQGNVGKDNMTYLVSSIWNLPKTYQQFETFTYSFLVVFTHCGSTAGF